MKDNYWQHKLSLWLHDPVHKVFDILHHESYAKDIAELLHTSLPTKDIYQTSDRISSGLSRASLPNYNRDEKQNGAVDFSQAPFITHPLVGGDLRLPIDAVSVQAIHEGVKTLLTDDLGLDKSYEELSVLAAEERPLNGFYNYKDSPEEWAKALYMYLFFVFKKRLRQENIGGLGGAWELLPADSRMPDHNLWHHLGLTSAIGSARDTDPENEMSLAVFAITPVQSFISRARKLRDHWVGSVLLSYLSFTGIRFLADKLGPDHIIYPSLHDQSLVEGWLATDFHLERFFEEDEVLERHKKGGKSIASFPNKFVFLCASAEVEQLCKEATEAVQQEWLRLGRMVKQYLAATYKTGAVLDTLFEHQISDYWQYSHATCKLAWLDDEKALADILAPEKYKAEADIIRAFASSYGQSGIAVARLYAASHSLVQSLLASAKLKPVRIRKPQAGEKCPLCGEHEVLHDFAYSGETGAKEYSAAVKEFWDRIGKNENSVNSSAQVGDNERICALCAIKRFLPKVLKQPQWKKELLGGVLAGGAKFPATTELAAKNYLKRLKTEAGISEKECNRIVDLLHDYELEAGDEEHSDKAREIVDAGKAKGVARTDRDKYYAMLLMDGDKIGDLVNGRTFSATWKDVLHPDLRDRFSDPAFQPRLPLRNYLDQSRTLNPALHAAISEALNSFARYSVAPIIAGAGGQLIYAGGDDVCAIMPLDTALEAAQHIQQAYAMSFVGYDERGAQPLTDSSFVKKTKMGMHLGKGEGISISAALVLAHEKTPLREVLRDAHYVLDTLAKKRAGRNAVAIRLKKRSGGDRDCWMQWNKSNPFSSTGESLLDAFIKLMEGVSEELLGGSLLYRLADLKEAVRPLVATEQAMAANRDKILQLLRYEIGHSGKLAAGLTQEQKKEIVEKSAERLAGLILRHSSAEPEWYIPETAIIGSFLAPGKESKEKLQSEQRRQ